MRSLLALGLLCLTGCAAGPGFHSDALEAGQELRPARAWEGDNGRSYTRVAEIVGDIQEWTVAANGWVVLLRQTLTFTSTDAYQDGAIVNWGIPSETLYVEVMGQDTHSPLPDNAIEKARRIAMDGCTVPAGADHPLRTAAVVTGSGGYYRFRAPALFGICTPAIP